MVPSKTETSRKLEKKSAAKKKSTKKKPSETKAKKNSKTGISAELRYVMIAETAYFIAEKAGFDGDNVEFWLAAEKEIDEKFSK